MGAERAPGSRVLGLKKFPGINSLSGVCYRILHAILEKSPVFPGRGSGLPFEKSPELALVVETAFMGDLTDRIMSVREAGAGFVDPGLGDKTRRRHCEKLAEVPLELAE